MAVDTIMLSFARIATRRAVLTTRPRSSVRLGKSTKKTKLGEKTTSQRSNVLNAFLFTRTRALGALTQLPSARSTATGALPVTKP